MNHATRLFSKEGVTVAALFGTALLIFVIVRLVYWNNVTEEPFSDMADYIHWGRSWAAGDWMMEGQFWGGAYKAPGVPLLYAGVFAFTGGHDVDVLRWVQLAISVFALAFFAWQLTRTTGTLLAGLLVILVVTFTKSSVFWSFKVGTETLSEAMLYLSLGAALWVWRDSASRWRYVVLAVVTVYATFVRPNSLPLVGVLVLFPLFKLYAIDKRQSVRCMAVYTLAVVCAWAPWIARNYAHCGQFVPLSTQGPYTFLWELGDVDLPGPDGKRMVVHVNQLQAEAPKRFANDCEASKYAMGLVKLWMTENIATYPALVKSRLLRYTTDRQIDLTRVSRSQLHPDLDPVLIDKTQAQIVLAAVIGLAMSVFYIWARVVFAAIMANLLFSSLFLGDARMIEPFIPIIIFLSIAPIVPLWKFIKSRLSPQPR